MKKSFILSLAFVLFSTVFAAAQNIVASIAPPPSGTGTVGQPMEFETIIEALGGTYTNFQWVLSFPTEYISTPNAPTGTPGVTWSQTSPGVWTGQVSSLSGVLAAKIIVMPIKASSNLQDGIVSVSGFWENNAQTSDDYAISKYTINPGAANTITVTPPTSSVNTGTPVTLTASGCTGGTYTWSPMGGTAGGTGNSTYTVTSTSATSATYTATCSSGGSGTASVSWQTTQPTCLANAGTLN